MINSFISKWSEAIMDELQGGDIWGPPLPLSGCLKADEYLESQNPKSHSHQPHPPLKPSSQSLIPGEAASLTPPLPSPTQLPQEASFCLCTAWRSGVGAQGGVSRATVPSQDEGVGVGGGMAQATAPKVPWHVREVLPGPNKGLWSSWEL